VPNGIVELSPIEAIQANHNCHSFDSGKSPLDDWLRRYALQSQLSDGARTFVVHEAQAVKGYYSLASGNVSKRDGPARLGAGLGNYPIPVIVLARLAVDRSYQRRGVGKALLKDAMLRVIRISENVGVRALIVDAIDEEARLFYASAGFAAFPEEGMRLMMLLKDLRASFRGA
jgi:GNAT superfamily N-acetyltransferase